MISERVLLELKSGDSDLPEEFPLTWIGHNRFMISSRDMINYLKKAIERYTTRNRDVDDRGYEKMIQERANVIRKLGSEVYKSNFFDHNYMLGCGACNPNFYPNKCGNCTNSVHPQVVMNNQVPIQRDVIVNHPMPAPIVVENPVLIEKPVMMQPPTTVINDPVYMQQQLPTNRFGLGYSGLNDQYAYPFNRSMYPYHNRSYLDSGGIDRFPLYRGTHMGDGTNRFPVDYRNQIPIEQDMYRGHRPGSGHLNRNMNHSRYDGFFRPSSVHSRVPHHSQYDDLRPRRGGQSYKTAGSIDRVP